jgi:hypothetical protein
LRKALQCCCGVFFSGNQRLFEEAFLPTLRTILNAPTTSPLSGVNASNVAEFFVELTHVQRLVSSQASTAAVKVQHLFLEKLQALASSFQSNFFPAGHLHRLNKKSKHKNKI